MDVHPFDFKQEFPATPWQIAIGFMVKDAANTECFWCGECHALQTTFWGLQLYRDEPYRAALGFDCADDPDLLTNLILPIATRIDASAQLVWVPKPAAQLDEFHNRAASLVEPQFVQPHPPFTSIGPEIEVWPALMVQGATQGDRNPPLGWIAGDRRATGWETEVVQWLRDIAKATGFPEHSLLAANPFR